MGVRSASFGCGVTAALWCVARRRRGAAGGSGARPAVPFPRVHVGVTLPRIEPSGGVFPLSVEPEPVGRVALPRIGPTDATYPPSVRLVRGRGRRRVRLRSEALGTYLQMTRDGRVWQGTHRGPHGVFEVIELEDDDA